MAKWKSDAATDRQRDALREMGVDLPPGATKGEASRLIGLARYGPAHPVYVDAAAYLGIVPDAPLSRDDLLQQVMAHIRKDGNERDLCAWYAWRAYRKFAGHPQDGTDAIDDPLVIEAAEALFEDPSSLASVKRMADQGDARMFRKGDSAGTQSVAYRHARKVFLGAEGQSAKTSNKAVFAPPPPPPAPAPSLRADLLARPALKAAAGAAPVRGTGAGQKVADGPAVRRRRSVPPPTYVYHLTTSGKVVLALLLVLVLYAMYLD